MEKTSDSQKSDCQSLDSRAAVVACQVLAKCLPRCARKLLKERINNWIILHTPAGYSRYTVQPPYLNGARDLFLSHISTFHGRIRLGCQNSGAEQQRPIKILLAIENISYALIVLATTAHNSSVFVRYRPRPTRIRDHPEVANTYSEQ
jgi:hypothetical protein